MGGPACPNIGTRQIRALFLIFKKAYFQVCLAIWFSHCIFPGRKIMGFFFVKTRMRRKERPLACGCPLLDEVHCGKYLRGPGASAARKGTYEEDVALSAIPSSC